MEDLTSKNGTFINNRQITTPSLIADGDELGFGDVVLVAEIRQPAASPAALATVVYGAETPSSVPAIRPGLEPMADLTVAEEPVAPRVAPPAQALRVVSETRPPQSRKHPVVVEVTGERELAHAQTRNELNDVVRSAHNTLAWLRELETQLGPALELFERAGGRAAVRAFIAQAQRVESNPRDAADLQAVTAWLPTARSLLQAELALVDLLSTRSSDAHE